MSINRFSTRLGLESLGERLCPSTTGGMGKVSWSDSIYGSKSADSDPFDGHGTHVGGTIGAIGNNSVAPARDDVVVDGRIITGENFDSAAIAFVGGWGSSAYQYAFNDPSADAAPDDLASDETETQIASHGYIRIKKLNSGG